MILAAGKGERLAPLTDRLPKPLLGVGGETLIERHLGALSAGGIGRVVVNVSHLGELIEQRLGSGARWGLEIVYSREPDGPLETAGGIVQALPLLGEDAFLVVNGDIWTDCPLAPRALPAGADAHLVLVANPAHNPRGDFTLTGGAVERRARNSGTYAGIAVFAPALFAGLAPGRRPLAPLLQAAAARGRVSGEFYGGSWLDVGTPGRLARARRLAGRSKK